MVARGKSNTKLNANVSCWEISKSRRNDRESFSIATRNAKKANCDIKSGFHILESEKRARRMRIQRREYKVPSIFQSFAVRPQIAPNSLFSPHSKRLSSIIFTSFHPCDRATPEKEAGDNACVPETFQHKLCSWKIESIRARGSCIAKFGISSPRARRFESKKFRTNAN